MPALPHTRTDFQRPVYSLLGLPIDALTRDQAIRRLCMATASQPCFLSTSNVNFLIASQSDRGFRNSVLRSDLSVADGMPLVWIARLMGIPIRERVAGSDLLDALIRGEGRSLKIFFFGGLDGAAETACERVNALHGPTRCVGAASPGTGAVEDMIRPETIEQINRSDPDFVVVALGAKKGQQWIESTRDSLHASIVSHLGAGVNFTAGTIARAPDFMRRLGLEWLWRVKEEPRLWTRYATDSYQLLRLMVSRVLPCLVLRLLAAVVNPGPPASATHTCVAGVTRLQVSGAWSASDLPALREAFDRVALAGTDVELDFLGLTRFDESFIGLLMLLYGHQSKVNRGFRVCAITSRVRHLFMLHSAGFILDGLDRAEDRPG